MGGATTHSVSSIRPFRPKFDIVPGAHFGWLPASRWAFSWVSWLRWATTRFEGAKPNCDFPAIQRCLPNLIVATVASSWPAPPPSGFLHRGAHVYCCVGGGG